MPLTKAELRLAYLQAWLEGLTSFFDATSSTDPDLVDDLDERLSAAPAIAQDESAHPADRLHALGLVDGFTAARTGYSAAQQAAPWEQLTRH